MAKASMRKVNGRWILTRPGYGFTTQPTVTHYPTFEAARRALTDGRPSTPIHTHHAWTPPRRDRYRYR